VMAEVRLVVYSLLAYYLACFFPGFYEGRVMGAGPLAEVRVIEIAGIGPGAVRCDAARRSRRRGTADRPQGRRGHCPLDGHGLCKDISNRGRPSVALDLKHPQAVAALLDLVKSADILIEGFRHGVMEGLGLGPQGLLGAKSQTGSTGA